MISFNRNRNFMRMIGPGSSKRYRGSDNLFANFAKYCRCGNGTGSDKLIIPEIIQID